MSHSVYKSLHTQIIFTSDHLSGISAPYHFKTSQIDSLLGGRGGGGEDGTVKRELGKNQIP